LKIKQENEEIKQSLIDLEFKHKNELKRLESKVIEINEKSENESMNYNKFYHDRMKELEQYQKNIKDLKRDINTKDQILDDLTREKEEYRNRIKE